MRIDADAGLPAGETVRSLMAQSFRDRLLEHHGIDASSYSITELIDSIIYMAFPNFVPFLALSLQLIYRFRPDALDPTKSLFEIFLLTPLPKDGVRPPPAEPRRLKADESFNLIPGMDPNTALVLDQDTAMVRAQQEGMSISRKKGATLANYQEIRIRHFERTIDKYVAMAIPIP
jgi:hypothetical protein